MLYAGSDLSRQRSDVHVLDEEGGTVEVLAIRPDADALRTLAGRYEAPVSAVVESMNGARFVHDELGRHGWDVAVADGRKTKGLAPLTAKTDKIDARVLAELCRRELVPAIWLPDPGAREARERSRIRLDLVRHRSSLKNRIHATLITFGHPAPVSDLFGVRGRELLASMAIPEPWATTLARSLAQVDALDAEIGRCEAELTRLGAEHPDVPLPRTVPGIGPVLGYTGLCPLVYQSGGSDRRGPLSKDGPKYLRWALIEATIHAARHPRYRDRYERTKHRLGRQRGVRVARVELARDLATAIWYMLTRREPFRAAGPASVLVA